MMDTSWEKRARGIATVSLVLQFRQTLHCQKQADLCEMAFTAEKNKDKLYRFSLHQRRADEPLKKTTFILSNQIL